MRRIVLTILALTVLCGCVETGELPMILDRITFEKIGSKLIDSPDQLTMKEVHLDNGTLVGREVIIEGVLHEVSEYYTYMVLSDETARMLVILTDLDVAGAVLRDGSTRKIRVLGTVESGKKGLPYVMARALNFVEAPQLAG